MLRWQIHPAGGSYRIVDIEVEGVSMALTQRQDFLSAIQSNGGKYEGLLASMQSKVEQLKTSG